MYNFLLPQVAKVNLDYQSTKVSVNSYCIKIDFDVTS